MVNQYLCAFFHQKLTIALLESEEENDIRKYFMIDLRGRLLPDLAGIEPLTSWSPLGRASNCATEADLKLGT